MKINIILVSMISIVFTACGGGGTAGNPEEKSTDINIEREISNIVKKNDKPIAKDVYISEILASNTHSGLDEDFYKFSDWIELHNSTNHAMDIGGFYISDDKEKTTKWKIPTGVKIPAKGEILIWADGKDKVSKELHANFKLSKKGENVILSDRDDNIIDSVTFTQQKSDISCSMINDELVYFMPTPKKVNNQAYNMLSLATKPIFSLKSGFFPDEKIVTLFQENGANIYYTVDGTIPTKNATLYTKPLAVNRTVTLKAIAIEDDKLPSDTENVTYFIGESSTLPVVSLSTDEKYLFDDKIGMYVAGKNGVPLYQCKKNETVPKNYAQKWKRPVHFEYYDANHQQQFSLDSNFKISGQCSRHNKKKSFTFQLDSKYGTKSLDYKLYPRKNLAKIKDFKLRTGGSGYKIGDILAALIVEKANLNIDYQGYRATQMFMNGEYWGIYNFREKKGLEYLKSNYPNISKKKIDIINVDSIVKEGDREDYKKLGRFISRKNYNLVNDSDYQEVLKMIDENSFIDYISLMIYSGNDDWIYSNQRCWKEKKKGSKWRWMLDDLDRGFRQKATNRNLFTDLETQHGTMSDTFIALSKNRTFKAKFKTRFGVLLNSVFAPAYVKNLIKEISDERINYINREKKRWGRGSSAFISHINETNAFAERRSEIVKIQLSRF